MNHEQHLSPNIPELAVRRPLSAAVCLLACIVILAALYMRLRGDMLIGPLNDMDAFTPVMISILLVRGIYSMRKDTDLQAVSVALIGALSFIFIYEAIYKISFYAPPRPMPSAELREFLIQAGIALTAVAGFAFGKFRLSKPSLFFLGAFAMLYAFWILVGYPQVSTGANVYWTIIPIHFTWNMIYLVNRGTKVLMFLAYLFFYQGEVQQSRPLEPMRAVSQN